MTSRVLLLAPVCALLVFACGASAERTALPDGSVGFTLGQDTIKPAAPPGEPAAAFPAPVRPVADIVAARWTDEDSRDDAGEFRRVAELARIRPGLQVADIGAGDGYYVARLSPLVGATGRVYGQDIIPEYLRILQQRVRRDQLANVQVVFGEAHDPRLPAATIDLAIMIHMYHEIEHPFALLWNLVTALKPGGRLLILDLDRPTYGHGTPPQLLRCELKAVGYREVTFRRTASEEYVVIFEAPALAQRPTPAAISEALRASPCRAPGNG